jgi:hypothetical protein
VVKNNFKKRYSSAAVIAPGTCVMLYGIRSNTTRHSCNERRLSLHSHLAMVTISPGCRVTGMNRHVIRSGYRSNANCHRCNTHRPSLHSHLPLVYHSPIVLQQPTASSKSKTISMKSASISKNYDTNVASFAYPLCPSRPSLQMAKQFLLCLTYASLIKHCFISKKTTYTSKIKK